VAAGARPAGTENVTGIAAFGAAAAAAQRHFAAEAAHMLALRNRLESGLKAISPHAVIFGEAAGRLSNTTLFAVEGMKAETAVIAFDLEASPFSPAPPAPRAKCSPPMCLRPWRFPLRLCAARCA